MLTRSELFFQKKERPEEYLKGVIANKVEQYAPGIVLAFSNSQDPNLQRLALPLAHALQFKRLHIIVSNAPTTPSPIPRIEFSCIPNKRINKQYARRLAELKAEEPKLARAIVINDRNFVRNMTGNIFGELDEYEQKMLILPFAMAAEYFRIMELLDSDNSASIRSVLTAKPNFAGSFYETFRFYGDALGLSINEIDQLFPRDLQQLDFGLDDFIQATNERLSGQRWNPRDPGIISTINLLTAFRKIGRRGKDSHKKAATLMKAFIELRALYMPSIINVFETDPMRLGTGADVLINYIVNRRGRM